MTLSLSLIESEYNESLKRKPTPRPVPRLRKNGQPTRDPDWMIAATVSKYYMKPTIDVAEIAFGEEWDKPSADNPLGCLAWASRQGWFEQIHRQGQAQEMARLRANGFCLADFT